MSFQLHERLAADCIHVSDLKVCSVLLMNDARYPWLILVPRRSGLTDLHQIEVSEQPQVFREITLASSALETLHNPHKLNVAALGNQVPQLHIHIIARRTDDATWPAPVWGVGEPMSYAQAELDSELTRMRAALSQE